MAANILDSSNPRLWLVRYPKGSGVSEYVASVEAMIERKTDTSKFAVLFDMRDAMALRATTAKARKQASALLEQHKERFADLLVCAARVTEDPILRGVLTVYDFMAPAAWERKSFSSGRVAEAWARDRLKRAGVECPAASVWIE